MFWATYSRFESRRLIASKSLAASVFFGTASSQAGGAFPQFFPLGVEVLVGDEPRIAPLAASPGVPNANVFRTFARNPPADALRKVGRAPSRVAGIPIALKDLFDIAGIYLDLKPEQVARCIEQVGVGFMFAPNHHPAMKNVVPIRKQLGVRTIFNILGPLTNPADAKRILMGVFHPDLVGIQARVLQALGMDHALVVYGRDGLDEISLEGPTLVGELKDGVVREYEIHPKDFGLNTAPTISFKVANAEESKKIVLDVIDNKPGPASDIVCLNAGATLYVAGIAPDIASGITKAKAAISSGVARQKLDAFVASTQSK